jgi:hypothetical protein
VPQAQFLTSEAADILTQQMGGEAESWLAASPDKITEKYAVPNFDPASNGPPDPDTAAKMETAEGQSDAQAARSTAAAMLARGTLTNAASDPSTGEVVAAFFSSTAVSEPNETPSKTVAQPVFPGGHASAVTKKGTPAQIIANEVDTNDPAAAILEGQLPVEASTPLVALTLSKINVNSVNKFQKGASTFEAEVFYEFDVTWSTTLVSPQFELDCVSGNHFDITASGGTQHLSAKGLLLLYPGVEDAYCYASHNGNTLGNASARFLVGDAAEATQRAIQVETDSVALDLTLTADAAGTLAVEQTARAATEAVLGTQHALETEVIGTQTAEFRATITEIARQTEGAVPAATETPSPTPTFEPVVVDSLFHPGNVFAVNTNVVLQPGRLYRFCFSGTMNLKSGPAKPSDVDHVNGIGVPISGCLVLEGTGAVATISCGQGEPDAEDPGGFAITVTDLGPS